MNYIKNFIRMGEIIMNIQPYNHSLKCLLFNVFEVVTGHNIRGYNPVTTAYTENRLQPCKSFYYTVYMILIQRL